MPDGFKRIDVPESKYQVYTLSGEIPAIVGEAWAKIWESGLRRAYSVDYDRYSSDGDSSAVTIYVAI